MSTNDRQAITALRAAVVYFGSQAKLAKAVRVKQPSIAGALMRGKASRRLAIRIDKASDGHIPQWKLRPDLFKRGSHETV